MLHLKRGRKFGRKRKVRRGFLRSILNNFVSKGKIKTTEARAKEIKPLVEKMISRARIDSVSNRRFLSKILEPEQIRKIFKEIAPGYKERKGGYARIIKLYRRKGDASPMAIIELIKS